MTHYDHDLQVQIITNLREAYPNPRHVQQVIDDLDITPEKMWFNLHYLIELGRVRGEMSEHCRYPGIDTLPTIVWATAVGIEWLFALDNASALDA